MGTEDDVTKYRVLLNDDEQFALWPDDVRVPAGWRTVSEGTRTECLEFIDREWTDMRPRSLRQHLAAVSEGSSCS